MSWDIILFDLDGTLTDPKVGITTCAAYGLKQFGIEVEDLDTHQEDHVADECRYFCMSRPIKPFVEKKPEVLFTSDPLDQMDAARKAGRVITTQVRMR